MMSQIAPLAHTDQMAMPHDARCYTAHCCHHGSIRYTCFESAAFLIAAAALAMSQCALNSELVSSEDAHMLLLFTWSGNERCGKQLPVVVAPQSLGGFPLMMSRGADAGRSDRARSRSNPPE